MDDLAEVFARVYALPEESQDEVEFKTYRLRLVRTHLTAEIKRVEEISVGPAK